MLPVHGVSHRVCYATALIMGQRDDLSMQKCNRAKAGAAPGFMKRYHS